LERSARPRRAAKAREREHVHYWWRKQLPLEVTPLLVEVTVTSGVTPVTSRVVPLLLEVTVTSGVTPFRWTRPRIGGRLPVE